MSKDLVDFRHGYTASLQTQNDRASRWRMLGGCANVNILSTVVDAVEFVRKNYNDARVIVVGCSYLTGAVRTILDTKA